MGTPVRVNEDNYESLKREAQADGRTPTNMLNRILDAHYSRDTEGVPVKTGGVPKIEEVKTFVAQGQAAQKAVDDLLGNTTPEKNISEANASGVSSELPCCLNETQPCKHWVWDVNTGDGYKNILSGRFLEVE